MKRLKRAELLLLMVTSILVVDVSQALAQGFDRVRHRNGIESGKITKMNALGVVITKGGVDKKMPGEEILTITFAGEPQELARGRKLAIAGRYEDALKNLDEVAAGDVERPEMEQDLQFYITLCHARRALAGQGGVDESLTRVKKFLSTYGKSYHVPEAIELLGGILMASEDYEGARQQYAKLGKAPAPYYQSLSAYLTGLAFKAEGKHQESVAAFDAALKAGENNSVAKSLQLKATLNRAVSQAALGNATDSTETVKQIIRETKSEEIEIFAEAYNALGECYLQTGEKKAALLAFLHVDALFSAAGSEHAKALHELSLLWKEAGKATRADDAQQRLKEKYPSSQWARN